MNRTQEHSLAWDLVESATRYLTPDMRTWLCAYIGAGDLDIAIQATLSCLAAHRAELPQALLADLRDWLGGYEGSVGEDVLNGLIAQLAASVETARGGFGDAKGRRRLTTVRALTPQTRRGAPIVCQ